MVWTGTRGPREDGHGRWWRGDLESRCSPDGTLDSENRQHTVPRLDSPAFEWDRPTWQRLDQGNSWEKLLLLSSLVTVAPPDGGSDFAGVGLVPYKRAKRSSTPGVVGGCGPGREGGHLPSPRPITAASPPPPHFTRQLPRPACINHHQLSGTSLFRLQSSPSPSVGPSTRIPGVDRGRGRDAGRARSALLRKLAPSIVTRRRGHRIWQTSKRCRHQGWVCGLGMHSGYAMHSSHGTCTSCQECSTAPGHALGPGSSHLEAYRPVSDARSRDLSIHTTPSCLPHFFFFGQVEVAFFGAARWGLGSSAVFFGGGSFCAFGVWVGMFDHGSVVHV